MSFLRACNTYYEYATDPEHTLLDAPSLAAAAPLIRGTILQTFVALRMREGMAPCLRVLLNRNDFDTLIVDETTKFFGKTHHEPNFKAFHGPLGIIKWPMNVVFDNDNVLRYMIGNINFSSPVLFDVSEVLIALDKWKINTNIKIHLTCVSHSSEDAEVHENMEAAFAWCCTTAADTIVRTSFAVGWERHLLGIVRGFTNDLRCYAKPHRGKMLQFLAIVETKTKELQHAEARFYTAAFIALSKKGMSCELRHMILPSPLRDGGVPLASMPKLLRPLLHNK